MITINFDDCQRIVTKAYGGNAGMKNAYLYDGSAWMVKFPESTRRFVGAHLPPYTSSPLSEYVGSHVYEALGIPVHETVLGVCQGKVVVGCRDFTDRGELLEYRQIKNTVSEERISGEYGSSGRGERLQDVLTVIDQAEIFRMVPESVTERFWDMFVTDALIVNNDRNNGNWGLLVGKYAVTLAPVFDNGNALFNKRDNSVAERRLMQPEKITEDALQGLSFFTDQNDQHINPFAYIRAMENEECNAAVLRFAQRYRPEMIHAILDDIPETINGIPAISPEQREMYRQILLAGAEKGILPVAEMLEQRKREQETDDLEL